MSRHFCSRKLLYKYKRKLSVPKINKKNKQWKSERAWFFISSIKTYPFVKKKEKVNNWSLIHSLHNWIAIHFLLWKLNLLVHSHSFKRIINITMLSKHHAMIIKTNTFSYKPFSIDSCTCLIKMKFIIF